MTTRNDAKSNKWLLSFGEANKLGVKIMTAKTTAFEIPGCSVGSTRPSRNRSHVMIDMGSDMLEYDPLVITFVVDEDYANYILIRNWMIDNVKSNTQKLEDVSVSLLNHSGKPLGVEFVAQNARPQSVSAIQLDTESNILLATATFVYQDTTFGR